MPLVIEARVWEHAPEGLSFATVRHIGTNKFLAASGATYAMNADPYFFPLQSVGLPFTEGKMLRLERIPDRVIPPGDVEISFVEHENDPIPPGSVGFVGEIWKYGSSAVSIGRS